MIKYTYLHEGIGGFYKGISINVIKVAITTISPFNYASRCRWAWG